MVKLVRIVVSKFGEISYETANSVLKTMRECYERLKPHDVELVDLYLFERSSSADAFLSKEASKVGVVSSPFGELFFATHDAWRGTPRIILCLEKMQGLLRLVQVGGIRHEVGHSILHGSIQYYLLPLPPAFLELIDHFGLSTEYAMNLLYLISIAVKDYEVTRLLHQRGYLRDQVAYAKHLLKFSESDVLSWEASRGKPLAEILCLTSCLKASGCAAPLLLNKACHEEIKRRLKESLAYLPQDYSSLLLNVISEDFLLLGTDTLSNICEASVSVAEKIIKTILKRQKILHTRSCLKV